MFIPFPKSASNTTRRPSRDHAGYISSPARSVRRVVSPDSISTVHTSQLPQSFDMKAMRLPSGAQRGVTQSPLMDCVRQRLLTSSMPSKSATQISKALPNSSDWYAIMSAFGAQSGQASSDFAEVRNTGAADPSDEVITRSHDPISSLWNTILSHRHVHAGLVLLCEPEVIARGCSAAGP